MKEKLIDTYEVLISSNHIIISIVKKNDKYIVEKCVINDCSIKLLHSEKFNTHEQALKIFDKLKATI